MCLQSVAAACTRPSYAAISAAGDMHEGMLAPYCTHLNSKDTADVHSPRP